MGPVVSGASREWLASTNFVMIHMGLVDALHGSYAAAALFQRIDYRADATGWWVAGKTEMAEDLRVSERVLDRAIKELRGAGFIESQRVTPYNPTLKWRCVFNEEDETSRTCEPPEEGVDPEGRNIAPVKDETSRTVKDETSRTSTKNVENKNKNTPDPQSLRGRVPSHDYSGRKRSPLMNHVTPPR